MFNIFKDIHRGPLPPITDEEIEISARLRAHVEMLASTIGERNIHTRPRELERAADYVQQVLREMDLSVGVQPFSVAAGEVRNLDTEIMGTTSPDEIIVVGAHYDSVINCPGANDNATGVAATLEIARLLRHEKLKRTLRFVAFVNEEPPFFQTDQMGSVVYAKRCRQRNENIVAMITPETIGCYFDAKGTQHFPPPLGLMYPSVGNFIAFVGNAASSKLVETVAATFRKTTAFPAVGFAAPGWVTQAGWSDHWSFWKQGYPALMATDTAPLRYKHYHTPQDTPEKIDYDRTARVVAGLARVVRELTG
jgi:Zn-dependent M28 family amino/carboxypeptidase